MVWQDLWLRFEGTDLRRLNPMVARPVDHHLGTLVSPPILPYVLDVAKQIDAVIKYSNN